MPNTPTPLINSSSFAPARIASISTLVNLILPLVFIAASLIFFVMMAQASFIYITSGGTPENIAKSQKMFIYSGLGLLVVFGSFAIIKLIAYIFNIPLPF